MKKAVCMMMCALMCVMCAAVAWAEGQTDPAATPQVIVTAQLVNTESEDMYTAVYMPRIEIVGNAELTDKINAEAGIAELVANAEATAQTYAGYADPANDIVSCYVFGIEKAECVGDALGLQLGSFGYTTGMVYFDTVDDAMMLDITTGERLMLTDMLDASVENARKQLFDVLCEEIEVQVGWVWTTFEDVANALLNGTEYELNDLTDVPLMSSEGLVLQFSAGDIAPNAGGNVKVVIPFERLAGIFDPRFLPAEGEYTGTVEYYAAADVPAAAGIHGTQSSEAAYAAGSVNDLCIEETRYPQSWSFDNAGSYGSLVFYANHLTDELVWIPDNAGGMMTVSYNDVVEERANAAQ